MELEIVIALVGGVKSLDLIELGIRGLDQTHRKNDIFARAEAKYLKMNCCIAQE